MCIDAIVYAYIVILYQEFIINYELLIVLNLHSTCNKEITDYRRNWTL